MKWFAATDPDGVVQSFCSDDSSGYGTLPKGWTYQGPFNTQDEAIGAVCAPLEAQATAIKAVDWSTLTDPQKIDAIGKRMGIA